MRESNQISLHQLTKMGGKPLAPSNTQWGSCSVCGGWMQFRPVDVYQLLRSIRTNEEFDGNAAVEAFPKARLEDIGAS